jgi:hypothetical protein
VSVFHARGRAGKFEALLPVAPDATVIEGWEKSDRAAKALAEHLERTLESPVGIRFEGSPVEIPLTRAEHDLLILQAGGRSLWQGFGNARKQPEPGDPSAWEAGLEDGDALYIPAGWWRSRRPDGHATREFHIVIESPTGQDLVHWVADLLKYHELFQAPVPRFADPGTRAEYLTTLRQSVTRAFREPGLIERYRRHLNRKARRQNLNGAPWTPETPEDYLITFAMPRNAEIRRAGEDTICVLGDGQRFTLPEAAAPLLLYLRDQAPVSISTFYSCFEGEFHREELSEFLADLSRGGLLLTLEADKSV